MPDFLLNPYVIFAFLAVGVVTFYMAAVMLTKKDRVRTHVKLSQEVAPKKDQEVIAEKKEVTKQKTFADSFPSLLRSFGLTPQEVREKPGVGIRLQQAGLYSDNAAAGYMLGKLLVQPMLLLAALLMMAPLLMGTAAGGISDNLSLLVGGGILLLLGLRGADIAVANTKQKREKRIKRTFPDALDLLLVCIESGLGLDAALNRVCKEMKETTPDIAMELDRTRIELSVMGDRVQALQNLASRTGIATIQGFVAALIQTEKFGTSLADTLRVLSEDMRTTRLMDAENRAARLPALITLPLIILIMPAFMTIIMGPVYVKIKQQGGIFGR